LTIHGKVLDAESTTAWLTNKGEFTATITDVSTETIADMAFASPIYWEYLSTTFTVDSSESISGEFKLENTTEDVTIVIVNICITPQSGKWPDYKDADFTRPWEGVACAIPPVRPEGLFDGGWLAYLSDMIEYYYECSIQRAAVNAIDGIIQIKNGIGYLGQWLRLSLRMAMVYVVSAIKTYGSLWVNWLANGIAAIITALSRTPFFGFLIDVLGLLRESSNPVAALLELVYTLFVDGIIGNLFGIGKTISTFVTALKTAFTTSPATLGVPTCSTIADTATLAPMCWGLDAVDAIVEANMALSAALYVAIGSAVLQVIKWTMSQMNDVNEDVL
jgi:hypothetical protein